MLEVVKFTDTKRYGLQNTRTGIVIDREWRTAWGARRAIRKRERPFLSFINRLIKRKV